MKCYYCNYEFLPFEERYIVRAQRAKFQKRIHVGYCCDDCADKDKNKLDIKLWRGDKLK